MVNIENPMVSIIIPCKEIKEFEEESVNGCLNLGWKNIEILLMPDVDNKAKVWPASVKIIETGSILPAEKRNLGIKYAKGEYLAFLDSDAYPERNWLDEAIPLFKDEEIGLVGGPSLRPPKDGILRQASGYILSTKIGGGNLSVRYSKDSIRTVDDIPSSNMIIPAEYIKKIGGFNANFWPGEDSFFCIQIKKILNKKIVYSPNVAIYHHPRKVFKQHLKQIWGYGIHRGFFAKKIPDNSRHITYFMPSMFVMFNIIFPIGIIIFPELFFIPYIAILGLYFLLCIIAGIQSKNLKMFGLVLIGIPLTHITYGSGFMRGFLFNVKSGK